MGSFGRLILTDYGIMISDMDSQFEGASTAPDRSSVDICDRPRAHRVDDDDDDGEDHNDDDDYLARVGYMH